MKNTVCPCLLQRFASFCDIQAWSSNAPVTAWKKRDPIAFGQAQQQIEALREQAARGEIVLGYVDETGFSATPDNRYAWTKIGDVHAVDAVRLKRVNVMGSLLSTGHLITSCLQESINSRWFYAYLMGVAAQVKRSYQVPLVLIVDNASIHRSKQMVDWRKLLVQEYSTTLSFSKKKENHEAVLHMFLLQYNQDMKDKWITRRIWALPKFLCNKIANRLYNKNKPMI